MSSLNQSITNHRFRNNQSMIGRSGSFWEKAKEAGVIDICVEKFKDKKLVTSTGHEFINFSTCSYLGLHDHPAVIQGAVDAYTKYQQFDLSIAPVRIRLSMMDELENYLSQILKSTSIFTSSATVSTTAVLPLLASGHLTGGYPTTMVFDQHCHFSMALMKPICDDESKVLTCRHNDLDYLEDLCKKHQRVAYVGDGVYSMGGQAILKELFALQDKYGLFLYFDDAHSISIFGEHGEGYVRSFMDNLNPLTIIVGSLAKAYGASGGFISLDSPKYRDLLYRFGGPLGWSQNPNPAVMGAANASAKLHLSSELGELQNRLRENIRIFDSLVSTKEQGSFFPIRRIRLGEVDKAVFFSKKVYEKGFYLSPVAFPIVAKNDAGVRVMLRADVDKNTIRELANAIQEVEKIL